MDAPNGQYGICTLPDDTQIEEWELYRRDHTNPQESNKNI
ncbi:MAG: DUF333 domain-containing protein [Saezia sp.]